MSVREREEYYRDRAIEVQKGIVNFKSSATATCESFIWTYRTTSTDVISLITTTTPLKKGAMNDIQMKPQDAIRLKGSKKVQKPGAGGPYDLSISVDSEIKRKRLNQTLLSERHAFMTKLGASRALRSNLENTAATLIQAAFRGHTVRLNGEEIAHFAEVYRQIRGNIRSYMANKHSTVLSMSRYKRGIANVRNRSAVTIQCAFYRYQSRKCLRRRRHELWLQKRRLAAARIQAMTRGVAARARVQLLLERLRIVLVTRSITCMQTWSRRHLARRRVHRRRFKLHVVAARMILNWYRAKYSRKMGKYMKAMLIFRRTFNGAQAMQCLIRRFLAGRRADRIRLRRMHCAIFAHVTRINSLVRRFLAQARVQHKRVQVSTAREEAAASAARAEAAEAGRAQLQEMNLLLEGADIYFQSRADNTSSVEDIFTGLVDAEEHTKDDLEEGSGETVLTIAAARGNMDLVRKCLLWGFDVNTRNNTGLNAVMAAAKGNHLEVLKYLVNPPRNDSYESITPLAPISDADAGFLLVTAAANAALDDDLGMLTRLLPLGVDVNAKEEGTGMTALHAACEVGHIEAFKLLVKSKASMELLDETGQTPLHKACSSSHEIVRLILGLNPSFSTYMSDLMRNLAIQKTDADGKDCALHAALNGQSETLELLGSLLKENMKKSVRNIDLEEPEEIGWSPEDINRVVRLVESGNLLCLGRVTASGFDMAWVQEASRRNLAAVACLSGNTATIDFVLSHGVDCTLPDKEGKTALHHAAAKGTELLQFLLVHPEADRCRITEQALLAADLHGENVFHIAARAGVALDAEAVGQQVLREALGRQNAAGMTPLLVACAGYELDCALALLQQGADATAADGEGRNSLWHLFHRGEGRPACSEYVLLGPQPAVLARKDKDEEVLRKDREVAAVVALLTAGCTLYGPSCGERFTPEQVQETLAYNWEAAPSCGVQAGWEAGDVAVQELSITLLKTVAAG
ncbi:hypothetical protein B484DRAFT_432995, partial [Ochromonadaceae sp. CCMP2298]